MFGRCVRGLAIAGGLILAVMSTTGGILPDGVVSAQTTLERRARVKPNPVFPEIARRMRLSGTVRVEVTVAPNGTVVSAKPVGGHPILVESAVTAVKKWRFEPAPGTTTEVIPFDFRPEQGN